ncbi:MULTISPECIES: hypothetical protein [unclassified Variovorax]|uniref:hypothetical protein n=1 Tax=unclassified Variovorax TaxID=663243 RepID=UPI0008E681DF|nr:MULTISPECIES: hypothetical protein [unclassified Variovorax]TAJ59431.1 MAG: hypothetical protein EPO53_29410 [Variovorax sp.]SFO70706.1 hypothetical protein SAMN05443579_105251 [Variovorax sp. PDC80]
MNRIVVAIALASALAGCAGKLDYIRPPALGAAENSKIINKPRQAVWDAAVPQLGKEFFVINNLDKSSGLINISYTGDPEKYIDCGRIVSYVKNARGERTYDFAASKQQMTYEVMTSNLFFLNRQMNLEGRVNLIFEEVGPDQTRVSANTRYVVKRDLTVRDVREKSQSRSDVVNFNTNTSASFPPSNEFGDTATCQASGVLEREILSNIR